MEEKILSICIPTYNRAEILSKTLSKLVEEGSFLNQQIEICISNNASTDHTKEVVSGYLKQFPNIKYHRNDENTNAIDGNFPIVASMATGKFIKFQNDYAVFIPGQLDNIIGLIKENMESKPVLFFPNNNLRTNPNQIIQCSDLDSFVSHASYWTTWVGGAGFWKEDFDSIKDRDRSVNLYMWCPDNYLRLVHAGKKAIIYNYDTYDTQPLNSKGGYNFFKIFVNNYLGLYSPYRKDHTLSSSTLHAEKTRLLRFHLTPWFFDILFNKKKYAFPLDGAFRIIFKEYCFHPSFYVSLFYRVPRHFLGRLRSWLMKKK